MRGDDLPQSHERSHDRDIHLHCADEAKDFAARICAAKKATVPKRILEFGPTPKSAPLSSPTPHPFAKGFTVRRLNHPENDPEVAKKLAAADDVGIFAAWGHGLPDGVDAGPQGLIRAKIGAAFAGLDPDRGETSSHELEHVLTTGQPLGYAIKSTYDDVVVAYRRADWKLPRYVPGAKPPHRNLADTMIAGGACRALFGLPSWAPVAKAADDVFQVKPRVTAKGIAIDWTADASLGRFWIPVDVYRADGGWTHRFRFTFRVPVDDARKVRRLAVLSVTKDLPYVFPTAAFEHGQSIATPCSVKA
jgi:hypothetical protein